MLDQLRKRKSRDSERLLLMLWGSYQKNTQILRKQQILSKNAPWGSRCSEITALWILDEFLLTLGPLHALGAALLGSGQSHLEDT